MLNLFGSVLPSATMPDPNAGDDCAGVNVAGDSPEDFLNVVDTTARWLMRRANKVLNALISVGRRIAIA